MHFRLSIFSAVFSVFSLIVFGTWAFRLLEEWTWIQSFYFTVSTLTTVGYGDDIVPTSDETRLFAAIFILAGVGVMLAALTTIGNKYLSVQEKELTERISQRISDKKINK